MYSWQIRMLSQSPEVTRFDLSCLKADRYLCPKFENTHYRVKNQSCCRPIKWPFLSLFTTQFKPSNQLKDFTQHRNPKQLEHFNATSRNMHSNANHKTQCYPRGRVNTLQESWQDILVCWKSLICCMLYAFKSNSQFWLQHSGCN